MPRTSTSAEFVRRPIDRQIPDVGLGFFKNRGEVCRGNAALEQDCQRVVGASLASKKTVIQVLIPSAQNVLEPRVSDDQRNPSQEVKIVGLIPCRFQQRNLRLCTLTRFPAWMSNHNQSVLKLHRLFLSQRPYLCTRIRVAVNMFLLLLQRVCAKRL